MKMRDYLLFVVAISLAGCAANPDIGSLSSAQRANLANLKVYQGDAPVKNYEMIGTVKGLSCHRNAYKPIQMLSEEEAMQGVRMNAAKLGADAVVNTFCQNNSGTDLVNNCWASIVCAGDAVRFTK